MKYVLIVDDDTEHNAVLAQELHSLGNLLIVTVTSMKDADELLLNPPDNLVALLIDVRLPDGDGRDLCARQRAAGNTLPIILISGLTAEEDVVRGLESGADAYIRKPFSMAEILARLNVILARDETQPSAAITRPA